MDEIIQWALLVWVILREWMLRRALSNILNDIYRRLRNGPRR